MTYSETGPGVPGISITGEGVRFSVDRGIATGTRGDGVTTDPVATAINATDGLQITEAMSINHLEVTGSGGRGGAREGAVVVDLGRSSERERRIVLVEEDGQYTWALPVAGQQSVRLPVEAPPGTRGLMGQAIRRLVRIVAVKTVGWAVHAATGTIVGAWDERRHPHRLRAWTPEDHRDPNAPAPDLKALGVGPALLVIHGFMGSIHGSFGDLSPEVVRQFHRAYGGRTFAFDHPTLAVSPRANTEWLMEQLMAGGRHLDLDILAHSRGGLVAREVAQRLAGKGVTVRSITFVATPNDGTPLADLKRPQGLLDGVTNLASAVPGTDALQLVLELVKDIVVDKALTSLDGLVAMQPGGTYLTELNALAPTPDLKLRAISADFEPRSNAGIVGTARDRLIDAYFGGVRNDLIVPTLSTIVTGGTFRVGLQDRLVLDSSRGVDHSTFWTNDRAVRQLTDWLRPDWRERPPAPVPETEADPGAELALPPDPRTINHLVDAVRGLPDKLVNELVGGPINPNATPPTGDRPAVVVIPGIMGTHLSRAGKLIWLDPLRLMRGHFSRLSEEPPATDVQPAGLNRAYLPLITRLASEERDVYLAPYDWRLDIRDSARKLARLLKEQLLTDPKRQVHLVAHSMGGLVARALTVEAPEVWADMAAPSRGKSGRLIMLGTPNRGSYSIVLTLTGAELILKALAEIDYRTDSRGLVEVISTFPGVYQMLPAPSAAPDDDHHAQLFKSPAWGGRWPVRQHLLDAAAAFHQVLEETHERMGKAERGRMTSVAGYGHSTPYRLEIETPGTFSVGRIAGGDGRVALTLNDLEDVPRYLCAAAHGSLPSTPDVLDSLADLLNGQPGKLKQEVPEYRGAEVLDRPPMVPVEQFDPAPAGRTRGGGLVVNQRQAEARLTEALRLQLGGGTVAPDRPRIEVRVVHASLEQASFPVAVGHYAGVPIGGAEQFLDAKLRGALRQRQHLGQYPEQPGTALLVSAPAGHRPQGALVLGLGEFGTLTGTNLAAAMTQAVISLVLDRREAGTDLGGRISIGISSVLVGISGRHGLTVEDCVTSLVEGVIEAALRLQRQDDPLALGTIELELIESYQQPAEDAALVLSRLTELVDSSLQDQVELSAHDRLESRGGRQPGARPWGGGSNDAWVRVLVTLDDEGDDGSRAPGIRRMTFSTLARGAQANLIEHEIDLAKIGAYVDAAVRHPEQDSAVNRTLFELLFPPRAKLDLDRTEHLHLIVDEDTAQLPWELLAAAAAGGGVTSLALRAGMLRQLQSTALTRARTGAPRGLSALFVGDPPTAYPRLPNAREEAERLATLFEGHDWNVERRIYDESDSGDANEWMEVLNALYQQDHRVVHIAAHGVFDPEDRRRSGVALGRMPEQRLTALDFAAMSSTPDLVFLNCCHLGRMETMQDELKADPRALEHPNRVAGTVAQQLLRNGVRAVVVAGWAVDDFAAAAFASELYEAMLGGVPFGAAVHQARLAARDSDLGRSNTWGAYQCYGDPDFELVAREVPRAAAFKPVSPAQLARQLELAAVRASEATTEAHCQQVAEEVNALRAAADDLLDSGQVLEALGRAFSDLGRYQEAVDAYERARCAEQGEVRLQTVEQLGNLKTYLAIQMARHGEGSPEQVAKLFDEARTVLNLVERLGGKTAERHALRGGLEKRRATTLTGAERSTALVAARRAYLAAREESSPGLGGPLTPYHVNNWLQLAILTRETADPTDTEASWLDALYEQVTSEKAPTDYWGMVAVPDTLLTYLLAGRPLAGQEVEPKAVLGEYRKAFALRSTVRQRDTTIGHLEDLALLVPPHQQKTYADLVKSLRGGAGPANR